MAEAERQVLPRDKKLIGTPYWMAPEIIQEQGYAAMELRVHVKRLLRNCPCCNSAVPQSDVWSFGCTMVELTTGNAPLEVRSRCSAADTAMLTPAIAQKMHAMVALYKAVREDIPVPDDVSEVRIATTLISQQRPHSRVPICSHTRTFCGSASSRTRRTVHAQWIYW